MCIYYVHNYTIIYTCTVHVITLIFALHQTWQKQLGYYLPPSPSLSSPSLSSPSPPLPLSLPSPLPLPSSPSFPLPPLPSLPSPLSPPSLPPSLPPVLCISRHDSDQQGHGSTGEHYSTDQSVLPLSRYVLYIQCVHVLMRDEKEGRSKQSQTNSKAKQHSTPTVHVCNFAVSKKSAPPSKK